MKVGICASAVLAGAILLLSTPVQAHHSIANFWDISKNIDLTAVVKEVRLVNPHSIFLFEITENGQKAVWTGFGSGPQVFAKEGWTSQTLKIGSTVKISGHPPRNAGAKGILLRKIVTAEGKTYVISGGLEEEQEERLNGVYK